MAIMHLRGAMMAGGTGCGMLVLKHARVHKKREERAIRGAKAWKGACDSLIFHTRAPGRPREDGLHSSYLWPDKARAFGLKDRVQVTPEWVPRGAKKVGIALTWAILPE